MSDPCRNPCPKCGKSKLKKSAQCRDCFKEARAARVEKVCEECGKPFLVLPCRAKSARHCSLSCNTKKRNRVNPVRPRVHGHTVGGHSPTYKCWLGIRDRCLNPKSQFYAHYGGRGITVCERWLTFTNFLADMGTRPLAKMIDRRDVNGNYEPSNCRWATAQEQADNKVRTMYLTLHGETLTLTQWATRVGWNHATIRNRVARGWSDERALTEPIHRLPRSTS